MKTKPILFSDVDGSICFHQKANDIIEVEKNEDGTSLVRHANSEKTFIAHDVSTSSYKVFLAQDTRELLHRLRRKVHIVLVTGGRPSTCQRRAPVLDFADAVIAENGGVIYDSQFNLDRNWWNHLEPQRKLLNEVRSYIQSYGWNTDDAGRNSAIRVRLKDNPHKDESKFARLWEAIRLPEGLTKTINLENIDIILADAGKHNAVSYYALHNGYSIDNTYGIGDDINDIEFLKVCAYRFILQGAYPETTEQARRNGWFISQAPAFEGIREIIQQIQEKV